MKRALLSWAMVLMLALPGAALARDAMPSNDSTIDCSKSADMLHAAMPAPVALTGDVDKDTMQTIMAQSKSNMQLAKIEMSCGKDPKMKAMAKKTYDAEIDLFNRINHAGTEE